MILHLEWSKRLRKAGAKLGRAGLSKRAIEIMQGAKSYKSAMVDAGRVKAIAQAAQCDEYWTEQVNDGFIKEMRHLDMLAAVSPFRDENWEAQTGIPQS